VRTQWIVASAALVVLAATLVTWALGEASGRTDVVVAARPIEAGTVFSADDLTVAAVAVDGTVSGLVPAGSAERLVGRVAAVDLAAGSLVIAGTWADDAGLAAGEHAVGAVLEAGRFPETMVIGSSGLAVSIEVAASTVVTSLDGQVTGQVGGERDDPSTATPVTEVRVLDIDIDDQGTGRVELAVPAADAVRIARLAATDQLVLVGLPALTATRSSAVTDGDDEVTR
jgi:hypothetical protein